MSLVRWLNTAWLAASAREALAFRRATSQVAVAQGQLLQTMIRANRQTEFGERWRFDTIASPRAFQERVPLTTYDDYAAAIERLGAGELNLLTRERVERLTPTSGTTSGAKLIPYTASLRRQFQRGVAAWMFDLLRGRPALRRGRAYWSISPAMGPPRQSSGGIPVGFAEDAAYLGMVERFVLERLLVTPGAVAAIPDIEAFRYCTLWSLLRAADLTLISVWSPTFLTALLLPFERWLDRLCADIRAGTLTPPTPLPNGVAGPLLERVQPDCRRADQLASIRRAGGSLPEKFRQFWPQLAFLSCWADGSASGYVASVRSLLPFVEIQPKGLLATEGFVSLPLLDRAGAALAVRSHFFEFEPADTPAKAESRPALLPLAHQLEEGGRYRVVVTTAGGLYRYQLGDEVEVVGWENQCPRLRFLGRAGATSDLVGEKLAEPHVRCALERFLAQEGIEPSFVLLVPVSAEPPHYRLYLQGAALPQPLAVRVGWARRLEALLAENPYYQHAVRLGQLGPVDCEVLDPQGEPAAAVVERRRVERGQQLGTHKPAVLDRDSGWPEAFFKAGLQEKTVRCY